jgi:methanogenic corrinoid protein MtbC1
VHDLGIDVPTEKVVEFVQKEKPGYLGLSALLTTTMTEMGVVIKALEENNVRSRVKVLIGGAAVSDEFAQEIGADAYCVDAFAAVKVLDSYEQTS